MNARDAEASDERRLPCGSPNADFAVYMTGAGSDKGLMTGNVSYPGSGAITSAGQAGINPGVNYELS